MEIDFIQELKKRDELLDSYLRHLEDHISKITDIVGSV